MTKQERDAHGQVILALDAVGAGLPLLGAAVSLAATLELALRGLFVEDELLLRISELPFASEVVLATAMERELSGLDMARSLRARAAEARDRLSRDAARASVPWSFRTVRGRPVESVLAESVPADLVLLSPLERGAASGQPSRVLHGEPVYLYLDGSPEARHALAVLERWLGPGFPDVVMVVAREAAGRAPRWPAYRRIDGVDLDTLITLVRVHPGRLVVLTAPVALARHAAGLREILGALRCPVLVVR